MIPPQPPRFASGSWPCRAGASPVSPPPQSAVSSTQASWAVAREACDDPPRARPRMARIPTCWRTAAWSAGRAAPTARGASLRSGARAMCRRRSARPTSPRASGRVSNSPRLPRSPAPGIAADSCRGGSLRTRPRVTRPVPSRVWHPRRRVRPRERHLHMRPTTGTAARCWRGCPPRAELPPRMRMRMRMYAQSPRSYRRTRSATQRRRHEGPALLAQLQGLLSAPCLSSRPDDTSGFCALGTSSRWAACHGICACLFCHEASRGARRCTLAGGQDGSCPSRRRCCTRRRCENQSCCIFCGREIVRVCTIVVQ